MQDIVIFIECPGRTSSLLSEGNNDPEIESPFASRGKGHVRRLWKYILEFKMFLGENVLTTEQANENLTSWNFVFAYLNEGAQNRGWKEAKEILE